MQDGFGRGGNCEKRATLGAADSQEIHAMAEIITVGEASRFVRGHSD